MFLLIDSLRPYGAERVALDLAKAMSGHIGVVLVTYKGDAQENATLVPDRVGHVHLHTQRRGLIRVFLTVVALRRLAKKAKPAVIIGFMPYANTVAAIVGTLCGVPVIATEHNVMSIAEYGGRERPLLHFAMRRYAQRVAAMVAVSDAVADDLISTFGVPREKIKTIYNPVDRQRILDSAKRGEADVAPLSPGEVRIVILGKLKRAKGHADALHALSLLPAEYRLYVVGDGPLLADLQEEARRLRVSSRVSFVGWQHEGAAWLMSSQVVWIPSLWEGFGLVAAEACVLGRAVIPSAAPGLGEIADLLGYETIEPGDPEGLARATVRASSSARSHCRREALRHFDPERIATHYLELVSSVAT